MSDTNSFNLVTTSVILFFALLFSGCNSTSSGGGGGGGSSSPDFSSGDIPSGETFSYTFENEGTVDYYCEIHSPDMQGTIEVSSSTESAASDTVKMMGDSYNPKTLNVAPNTKVVWVNNDDHAHTVVSGTPSNSGGGNGGNDGGGYDY